MLSDEATREQAADATVIRSDRGTIAFWWASPRVLVVTLAGDVEASVAPHLASVLEAHVSAAARPVTLCWDLAQLHYFDPAVREVLTEAVRCRRRHVATVAVLATAPWVRLGVSAAALALALTDVRVTDDRAAFEHEVATAAVRGARKTTVRELARAAQSTPEWASAAA